MKKHFSTLLLAALSFALPQVMMAQTDTQHKMDVFAQTLIKQAKASQTNSATRRTAETSVRFLLRATDTDTVVQAIEALGGKAKTVADQMLSVTIPVDGIQQLTAMDEVVRIYGPKKMRLRNNVSKESTGVSQIHAGTALDSPYKGEGVLVKGSSEYLNAKLLKTATEVAEADNDLVATPATAQTITADTGYKLYRLTYDKTATKEGLGFYLGVVGESKDGSQLKATPGKAYLNVLTSEATEPSTAKLARGFAFPGDDDATGIECITVTDESLHRNGNAEGIFDLQGRKVSKPTKGVYINNGKKVVINL